MHLIAAVLVGILVPFLLGYPTASFLRARFGLQRLVWGGMLGLAILILVLRTTQYVVPLGEATWWLSGILSLAAIFGWARRKTRLDFRRDLATLTTLEGCMLVVCIIGMIVVLNIPILTRHYIAYEGTSNHDSIYYVTNARWMLEHQFFDVPHFSPGRPIYFIVQNFFGWGAPLARTGAEGLLAYFASISRKDPIYLYNGVLTAGALWAALSGVVIFTPTQHVMLRRGFRTGLYIPVLFAVPAILATAFNSNYSTIFGIVFATGYAVASLRECGGWKKFLLAGLMLATLLATYAELAPVVWLTLFMGVIARLDWRSLLRWRIQLESLRRPTHDGLEMAGCAVVTCALFWWISFPAFFVIKNAYFVSMTQGAGFHNGYAGLEILRYVLAYLTTSRNFAVWLPLPVCALVVLALVWLALRALSSHRIASSALVGAGLAFVLMSVYIWLRSFNYGQLKLAEYFALYMGPVAVLGSVQSGESRFLRMLDRGALAISFFTGVAACFILTHDTLGWANIKHVSRDLEKLSRAITGLPKDAVVAIGETRWPFYYSMWLPYLDPNTPMLFVPGTSNGGYLQPYLDKYGTPNYSSADYIVEYSGLGAEILPFPSKLTYEKGGFRLYRLSNSSFIKVLNAYAPEVGFRWLRQRVTFDIFGSRGNYLNISLGSRYGSVQGHESVDVSGGRQPCLISINTAGASFSIALAPSSFRSVTLAFTMPAVSPMDYGSGDSRKLTYRLESVSLSDEPRYRPLACGKIGKLM